MANYTMEVRQMMDNKLINGVFTFDYNFYSDNKNDKKEFEKLFIQHYYFREIGFETPQHFKLKLQARLNLIMPYYKQLALTEWNKLKTAEQMMTSKDLKESTTHEQTIKGNSSSNGLSSSNEEQSGNSSSTSTNEQTSSSTVIQDGKASNLADGVARSSLEDGYLTSKTQANTQTNDQTNQSSNSSNKLSSTASNQVTQSTSGNSEQVLSETTTFTSIGDIGVQTPAYAITEWRKVIININQMIIDECNDLFMKLY